MISKQDLDNWFMYHAPNISQIEKFKQLREKTRELADLANLLVPDCADKTYAFRELRNTLMAFNLAISCNTPCINPGDVSVEPY